MRRIGFGLAGDHRIRLKPRIALVLLLVLQSACGEATRPSDAALIANFQAHRTQVEILMSMMRADKVLWRVDDTRTGPADPASVGINPQCIAEYRRILAAIGYPRGFYYFPDSGRVEFVAWAVGLAVSGASKIVVYNPEQSTPLVADLDTYRPQPGQRSIRAYRHIEGLWYLEFDAN